jgi:4-amino-4-deoxy-L-arabinose transferase-like glycosyltransferase
MERQALSTSGVSLVTAMLFGLFAGLSMLTKGTASILVMAAAIVLVWQARRIRLQYSWAIVRRRLLAPTAIAAVVW